MEREPNVLGRSFVALLVALLSFFLVSCSGASYLVENGMGQWRLFNRARPVADVLQSPHINDSIKADIRVVAKAKDFAVREFGLKATKNYEQYVQLEEPCVIWAVAAAHPLELTEKKWKFPIVGEVPYLGFFKKESAEAEAARLKKENPTPDTWVRCVPAFSSLGWFPDPLYSSMIKGRERDIAELVIHESLHATVWVKSSVDFNEKLASFVGLEGSLRYAEKTGGKAALAQAKKEVAGEKLFGEFMKAAEQEYRERVKDSAAKEIFYRDIGARYEQFLAKRKADSFVKLKANFNGWNNAAFLAYLNYYSDYSVFEAMLKKCGDDLGRFVRWIVLEEEKATGRFESAPEEHLAEIVKVSSCVD
jgi:predicted aminopeptidase